MLNNYTQLAKPAWYGWGLCLLLGFSSNLFSLVQAQNSGSVTMTRSFSYSGQIVPFTVPSGVTSLTVEARGAEGGFGDYQFGGGDPIKVAGKGALITGVVSVSGGQTLKVLVGQKSPNRNGGGGGSFVTTAANAPLIIAGGGGGSGTDNELATKDGQAGQTGGNNGGSNGNGGPAVNGAAAGGGGLLTDGGSSDRNGGAGTSQGGKAFVNGGAGSTNNDSFGLGGFGGGGSGTGTGAGGGGGGYSGGGGASIGPGGGGGSYNIDPNGSNTAGTNSGNGLVTIRYQVPPCTPFTVSLGKDGDLTCVKKSVLLTTTGAPTGASYRYSPGAQASSASSATATVTTAGPYSVTVTLPGGCSATSTTVVSSNTAPPSAPTLATASGYPYPAGQTRLTISQNVGPVSLAATGCSDGQMNSSGGRVNSFTVSTASTGTQTYTATCTSNSNGCTSPAASFQLTVVPTTLSVLHRDQDYGSTQNNIIKPYLELANASGQAISYSEITVRYWFTSEGNAPPTNLAVYYAQLGAVNMKYVALSQPHQGASGYVEYSFPGGGSLGVGGNSGPIENGIQKTDGSDFNEDDDYSYTANYQNYVPNQHVTAYRNGTIFWGQEPTTVSSVTAVQVYTQAKDGTTTSQIQTRLELRNTGNVALAIQDFRIRYYFTSDNNQTANVYVDYADIGADNIQARVIKLPAPVGGADSYVELRTVPTAQSLAAMSSLGAIDFRLVRSDNGLFDQSNDYSFMANYGTVGLNDRVTVLLNNRLIFGNPPSGAPARVGASEKLTGLQVKVLGNPVVGSHALVEVRGVAGQAVRLQVVDLQGRSLHEQHLEPAGDTQQISLPVSSRGTLLLKVSTNTQQQSLKLLCP